MGRRTRQDLITNIDYAIRILQGFIDGNGRDIQKLLPISILRHAPGLLFVRIYKVGFGVVGTKGKGIIIARLPDGKWSAPSAVSVTAVGIGHQGGFEKVESIVPINEQGTLNAFCDFGGQFQLSINASISAGPVGRSANISLAATRNANIGATYMYSSSKGAFAGYGIESIKISESVNTNAAFYGRPITAKDILAGEVETPPEASRLYGMLRSMGACKADFQLGVSQDTNPVASLSGEVSPQYQHAPPNNSAQSFEDTQHHVPHGNTVLHTQPCCSICDDGSMADPANGGGPPMNSYDAPQKEHIVVAVLPYVAETPEELSFEVGDRIVVTQSHENRDRWWDGAIGDSRGKFLANYTKDV